MQIFKRIEMNVMIEKTVLEIESHFNTHIQLTDGLMKKMQKQNKTQKKQTIHIERKIHTSKQTNKV